MKQLLHVCENLVIVGLNDRAFLVQDDSSVCELLPPESDGSIGDAAAKSPQKQQPPSNMNEIQAVAITSMNNNQVWCAVSRYNKTLSLYCCSDSNEQCNEFRPTTVHKTSKRVLCLAFAGIPSENVSSSPLHVVIAGDLVGDATAYSLTDSSLSKLLLGHTASMLTDLKVVTSPNNKQYILTADRDEKVRVSSFPTTIVVEGYLLGHENYVTSLDACGDEKCVSCSGDGTVRLWKYYEEECKQLAVYKTSQPLPTRVATSPNGSTVAVIYDSSKQIDVLSTDANGTSVLLKQTLECPSQPLSVKFVSTDRFLVLTREPEYILEYHQLENDSEYAINTSSPLTTSLQKMASSNSITMPTTIIEVDSKSGDAKMQKQVEKRVGHDVKPWNKVERIQTAKQANKRREKRKRVEQAETES